MPTWDLHEQPGLLYVAATLLPLASFLVLLLAGGLRAALRPRPVAGPGGPVYQFPGGDRPVRAGAYIATAAIAGSFLLSLLGFILFSTDFAQHGPHEGHGARGALIEDEAVRSRQEQFESRWKGSINWAAVYPQTPAQPRAASHAAGLVARPTPPPTEKDGALLPGTVLQLGYRIDHLSAIMFLMVTLVATLIHVFSIGYMGEELQPEVEDHQVHTARGHLHRRGRFGRFFLFLSLFCFSMLNLILADNLFQVFVSWELVGLCSYLLIGFYYERQSASNAANKAFITNRIGDAGFIVGLLILWTYVGSFNFEDLFRQVRAPEAVAGEAAPLAGRIVRANAVSEGDSTRIVVAGGSDVILTPLQLPAHFRGLEEGETVNVSPAWQAAHPEVPRYRTMPYWLLVVAGLGIFLGCVGKSAQFPLHVWLPDAMEGPTPVSALIHAATMVAAGVYLVGRVFPLFTHESRLVIAYTGGITLFVAATIAVVMTDIKKVLAYSTVSQLGYMMLALGVGGWAAGLFHLVTHAFFKALLFLGSGSVIYGCHHEQDMLKMGGLYPKMKTTALTMLVGVLTIAGLPFFSGWYSKDAILANALGFGLVYREHFLLFLLPLFTAALTSFYMFRMWFLTFTGRPRDHHVYEHAHESPWVMTVPLIVLAFFSVVVAWGWPITDAEASFLEGQIHHAAHGSVRADFGPTERELETARRESGVPAVNLGVRAYAEQYHALAGTIALGLVAMAIAFAALVYYFRVLDPAEAREQFPALHRFLWHKWYFDELYSAALVRPALTVAGWCRAFDTRAIDGTVDGTARATVRVSWWSGRFDLGVVDGLVNLTGWVFYATGGWLRNLQTGYLRSYVLFLVLAAVGIFVALSYFVTMAAAG